MLRTRFPLRRWFGALALVPALVTLGAAPAVARSKAKDTPEETASDEAVDSPSETSTEDTTAGSRGTAPATPTSKAASRDGEDSSDEEAQAKEVREEPRPPAEPPQAPPGNAQPIPATVVTAGEAPAQQPLLPYVVHLGPESFPGRLRGLYGGSLWLEPTFTGLQWPYMAHTGIGVSGNVWIDSGYETIVRGQDQIPNSSMYLQQGRGVLRVTPTFVRGLLFVQGQAELVGNLCQAANDVCKNAGTFTTDDLWVRVGQWNRWDLKVGRFEAWEVYALGMGLEPYTFERLGAGNFGVETFTAPPLEAPTLYALNYLHDRPTDGLAVGYAALHAYATEFLRFELLAKLGTDNNRADNSTGDTPSTYFGGRPTAIFDVGWFKFRIGAEYQRRSPVTQTVEPGTPGHKKDAAAKRTQKGAGASIQFVIDPVIEFGVSAAIGQQQDIDAMAREVPENSFTTTSVGVFANVRPARLWLAGVGANWTAQTDSYLAANSTVNDYSRHLQGFVALQYLLAGQLFIKADVGLAQAYFQPSDVTVAAWSNTMYSGRVRLMYLY
jgi:hypothetical protein